MTRYLIELQAASDVLNRDPTMRLKGLLKLASRSFALRAVKVCEPDQQPDNGANSDDSAEGGKP